MSDVSAKCMICGKTELLAEDHKDYKKIAELSEDNQNIPYICNICSNKVRYESDDKKKSRPTSV